MGGLQVLTLIILALIVVPLPLAWLVGTLFPNGYTKAHTQWISGLARKEWKRILLCGVVIVCIFIFAQDNALQFALVAVAVLMGRLVAVSRSQF